MAYSQVRLLRGLPSSWVARLRPWVQGLRLLSVALLLVALLRPVAQNRGAPQKSEGIDIMLAIDTSGSMRALDLDADKPLRERRTRLGVVQDVVQRFVERRQNDQVGIVVFGAQAFLQAPLTLDHDMVATLLSRMQIGMAGDATAIGSGLLAAASRLSKSKAKSKVVVLLTDGQNNAGSISPNKAAEVAQSLGVRVYTIGAGSRGEAPFVLPGGRVEYQQVSIDEDSLTHIAALTGGAYFRAEDSQALEAIYEEIDHMEKTAIESNNLFDVEERFATLVFLAMLLVLAEVVLLGTRLARLP